MEREVLVTGIGGQGVQLAAKILAEAASRDGRSVMLFGIYGGMIRGGPSDSTIVAAEGEILAPPIIDAAWALVALHPGSIAKLLPKIRPGGVVVANSTLCLEPISRADVIVIPVPATRIAEQAGKVVGASMVALGAFLAATGFASPEAIAASMRMSIPAHRQSLLAFNESCLALGREYVGGRPLARDDARAW